MKCEDAAEFVSALYDGERIPREAAEHLGECEPCRVRLNAYSAIGAELRRVARLEEPTDDLKTGRWEEQERIRLSWWNKGRETMPIPKFAFALMLGAISLLSGGLVLVRARPGEPGPVLWLTSKLLPDGTTFHCALATDGRPDSDGCGHYGHLPHAGLLSVNVRFVRREGERVELGVKTRYENPPPIFTAPYSSADRLKDVAEESVWIEPGAKQEVVVAGLGQIELTGEFMDHKPPAFFGTGDTVDPQANQFRIVAPVLLRGKEVVFNFAGASSSGVSPNAGVAIYWPGEGRYLMSAAPFKDAVEGRVDVSQITFSLEGQDYVLLTAVPVTRSKRVWIKREPEYRPSEHIPGATDDQGMLGGESAGEFPKE
jgi:hypothetical protein